MRRVEWPTLLVLVLCYAVWLLAVLAADSLGWAAWLLLALSITLFSSLCHEVLHGHPFASRRLNAALVFPALNPYLSFERFRALHLAHHDDAYLTDPERDPESGYCDPADWQRYPAPWRAVLTFNNTLAGRLTIGTALSLGRFWRGDLRRVRQGDRAVVRAWLLHFAGLAPVLWLLLSHGTVSLVAYLVCAYAGYSLLMLRTFLEHQARGPVAHRVAVVEDRGPLAFLFLNNNLHAVHHRHPGLPWYVLPGLYRRQRAAFIAANGGYVYRSYWEVLRRYLFRAKEPVAHPMLPTAP